VLAVTGYGPFTQDPSRASRAGCDAVLSKPCSPEDLDAAITALIDQRRQRRA
jgi:DNA-binding response OmpR family regulator